MYVVLTWVVLFFSITLVWVQKCKDQSIWTCCFHVWHIKGLAVTNVVLAGPYLFSFSDVKQLGISDPPTARVDSIKIGLICQAFGSASLNSFSAAIGQDMFLSFFFKERICCEISFEINIWNRETIHHNKLTLSSWSHLIHYFTCFIVLMWWFLLSICMFLTKIKPEI